jgi:hypothetical protein
MTSTFRVLSFSLVLCMAACGKTPNPDVCCVSQADCNALGVDEPVRACGDGLVCEDHECVPPVCELDVDCRADAPFCANGSCVGCRDSSDCGATTPICDDASNSCRACSKDADCSSNVCDFETGMCIAAESVWYASSDGAASAPCSQQSPCALTSAIAAANPARPTVRMLPGAYNASVVLESTVSIHAAGASLLAPGTGLFVKDAANVKVFDLSITKQGGATALERLGVYCISSTGITTPKLRLERITIETQNDARPLAINQCAMTAVQVTLRAPKVATADYLVLIGPGGTASFDRSRLDGGGGLAAAGGQLTATNSILANLGGSPTEGGLLSAGGSISIAYGTIFESALPCAVGDTPSCSSAARTGVCIENSLVSRPSATDAINGDKCRCDYCMISPQQIPVVGSNNTFNAFLSMKDPMNGDFHLVTGSDAIDAAHPAITGTPDFDGTSRPQGPRSDVGAFEFKK